MNAAMQAWVLKLPLEAQTKFDNASRMHGRSTSALVPHPTPADGRHKTKSSR